MAILLSAGVLLSAGMLLLEWRHYNHRKTELERTLAGKAEVLVDAPAPKDGHSELPGLDDYSEMIERPLFMEGRRPVAEDAPEPVAVEKKPLTIKLMGIILSPGETIGLFIDEKGKYKRLRKNDSHNGWKLVKLESDKAIMEQEGSQEELKLIKPKAKKSPPGPPPPGQNLPGPPTAQFPGQHGPPANNPAYPGEPIVPEQPPSDEVDESSVPAEDVPNE